MLLVRHPATYQAERSYVLQVLLGDFLGLEWEAHPHDHPVTEIALGGQAEAPRLTIEDGLFAVSADQWLTDGSLPRLPLRRWEPFADGIGATLVQPAVPVLYGTELENGSFADIGSDQMTFGIDLLGGSFFQLTRYEEIAIGTRDEHERFPATASLASRAGFLDRPLVNEYLELLRSAIERLWPRLEPRRRIYRERLSHDVDFPTHDHLSVPRLLKATVGEIVRRHDPAMAFARMKALAARVRDRVNVDPYYSFDFIMDLSEERGLQSSFYLMAGVTNPRFDGVYSLNDPRIEALMRRIHERGHELGLHPSYGTFRHPALIRRERDALLGACERLGISQDAWGGRQHFLRWENPTTWRAWEDAELAYDSSLGYSTKPGFRCGSCYDYQVFDLRSREPLRLRERPLVVMDQSVVGKDDGCAAQKIEHFRQRCRMFGGDFTLLWHNSQLASAAQRLLYRASV